MTRLFSAALMIAMVLTALLAVLFLNSPPARGHSFYDAYCCSGQDCEPISETRVKIVPGGYLLDDRFFIKEAEARQAQDGNYHACFWPNPDTLRCFYKPAVGS